MSSEGKKITPIEFCYYLQGFNEIIGMPPVGDRWIKIKELIKTVDMEYKESTFTQSAITAKNFIMWLSGFAELSDYEPSLTQWDVICDHLALVFHKVTPERTKSTRNDDMKNTKEHNNEFEEFMKKYPSNPWGPTPYIPPPIIPLRKADDLYPPYTVTCSSLHVDGTPLSTTAVMC